MAIFAEIPLETLAGGLQCLFLGLDLVAGIPPKRKVLALTMCLFSEHLLTVFCT